jgi:hypothetical protein
LCSWRDGCFMESWVLVERDAYRDFWYKGSACNGG